jgi:predicted nucleic-acid-binding protein
MINIDTNIIVRVFLADDKEQYEEAKKIFNQNNKFYISSYVLLEFVWVLKSKKYTRQEIYSFLSEIIEINNLVIGQKDLIVKSLARYKKGNADFSDYMIYEDGFINDAKTLKTFDKKLLNELG